MMDPREYYKTKYMEERGYHTGRADEMTVAASPDTERKLSDILEWKARRKLANRKVTPAKYGAGSMRRREYV